MQREFSQLLDDWKRSSKHLPLIVTGARQVGKTWIIQDFGRRAFERMAYINFEEHKELQSLFDIDYDIERILLTLEAVTGTAIKAGKTLLFLDEIQAAHNGSGITALKYFAERLPELHVVVAGSLLGLSLHQGASFPVGKVQFASLYPMNFREFLRANQKEKLVELLQKKTWSSITLLAEQFKHWLKLYYIIGGMPQVVQSFIDSKDFHETRDLQENLLMGYERDFSKHAPLQLVSRIRSVWNSVPVHLSKEQKKFMYSVIQPGARAREYEQALEWLCDTGLCTKVRNIKTPQIPMQSIEDLSGFKLFCLDIGLLGAMAQLPISAFAESNRLFTDFKGALTEQFVFQQLLSTGKSRTLFYWSSPGRAEIDFMIQEGMELTPIEVKSEENLRSRSLRAYCDKFHPKRAIRTSLSNHREESWMTNWPLYAITEL